MELSVEKIVQNIRSSALPKKKVVFVSGNFNIVHPGHVRLLKFASECGQFLVVGVNPDGAPGVHLPASWRLDNVSSLSFVDHAFVLTEPFEQLIQKLQPDVVVKGKEHEGLLNPERPILDSYGGKLIFGSGDFFLSSSDLIEREFRRRQLNTIVKPQDFLDRHGIVHADLKELLYKFRRLKICVVGDLIVDEYINCDVLGLSQEDPTIAVTPIDRSLFLGGAAIVAAHARGLGASVSYFSISGDDAASEFALDKLKGYDVKSSVCIDDSRPTTLKQRYRANGKTLLRVNQLRQHLLSEDITNKIFPMIESVLTDADLLILSDFNYGFLAPPLVEKICQVARKRGVMMVADSQSSSQIGDVSRFKDMTLLTPTEREARLAMRDFNSGLVSIADGLQKQSNATNVMITLGAEGLLVYAGSKNPDLPTDQLPAFNLSPKDVSGAGDSLLACTSMALASGSSIWQAAYLGAIAAACQVSRVGNLQLKASEIERELSNEN